MSKIEVNAVEPQCGTTLTVGASGDTVDLSNASVTFPSGTGTVNWDTTAKTASFTAVSGRGYFVNTTSAAITVTLPASPSAGNIVSVSDYAKTASTNNITIARNSSNIDGSANDLVLSTAGLAVTLVYVDATKGWKPINSNEITSGPKFVVATGGTETTCGDCKIHTFTGPGTFCVTCGGNSSGSNTVSYMVVAGGGGGGLKRGGGGGAGGFREGKTPSTPYTASPIVAPAGLPVSAGPYPVTVGGGGTGGQANNPVCSPATTDNASGSNSSFSTITSAGGGAGGGTGTPNGAGVNGGSGGGGYLGNPSKPAPTANSGGTGNTPPVSPAQGFDGGDGASPYSPGAAGGGGGASEAGKDYNFTPSGPGVAPQNGAGGAGVSTSITGSSVARSGGGGTGSRPTGAQAPGGTGGGGRGSNNQSAPWGSNEDGEDGTTNTGGGGGGSGDLNCASGGSGGSGIVVIRYKYQ
tara:strand:- start:24 stop:1421 length:1398 start_codon:yes stop_codon:yes gene_type:complete